MSFWNTSSAAVAADMMGGSFPPDAPAPQNTGSVPPVTVGGGVPPPIVPVPMEGGIPLHMVGGVLATIPGVAPPHIHLEGMAPPQALFPPVSVPVDGVLPPHAPILAFSGVPHPAPPMAIIRTAEPFKLLMMKDAKAYLDHYSIIQYYLHCPEFLKQQPDDALITDSWNWKLAAIGRAKYALQSRTTLFAYCL